MYISGDFIFTINLKPLLLLKPSFRSSRSPNSSHFRKTLETSKMALSTVFRRASSTVATLAFRAARSPVSFRTGAVSAERLILGSQLRRGSVSSFSFSRFSTESAIDKTTADENLVSVIESEIECAVAEEAPHDSNIVSFLISARFCSNFRCVLLILLRFG